MKIRIPIIAVLVIFFVISGIFLYDSINLDRICNESGGNRVGDNCLLPTEEPVIDSKDELDWSQITLMKPNSMKIFYYPNPEKTENRDVFQRFILIRLPEHLGVRQMTYLHLGHTVQLILSLITAL